MKRLALFDLDGTLTYKDTFLEFLKFIKGSGSYYSGMLFNSPYLIPYKLGLYPNWKAKEKVLKYFLSGMEAFTLEKYGHRFSDEKMPGLLRQDGLKRLNEHLRSGDKVVLVSASCEEWVKPWADRMGIEAFCTKLQKENGIITGKISGFNNYGIEKARRIREAFDLSEYEQIFAYGDSRGDKEMLELATESFYKPFSSR